MKDYPLLGDTVYDVKTWATGFVVKENNPFLGSHEGLIIRDPRSGRIVFLDDCKNLDYGECLLIEKTYEYE